MSTQRPSVDVITGTIKANFPTRISFQVTSKIDSRTILGEQGAEQLLGMGDMLYMPAGQRPIRVHGSFVKDSEVEKVVEFLKAQREPEYVSGVTEGELSEKTAAPSSTRAILPPVPTKICTLRPSPSSKTTKSLHQLYSAQASHRLQSCGFAD